jgi:hypothetical protein
VRDRPSRSGPELSADGAAAHRRRGARRTFRFSCMRTSSAGGRQARRPGGASGAGNLDGTLVNASSTIARPPERHRRVAGRDRPPDRQGHVGLLVVAKTDVAHEGWRAVPGPQHRPALHGRGRVSGRRSGGMSMRPSPARPTTARRLRSSAGSRQAAGHPLTVWVQRFGGDRVPAGTGRTHRWVTWQPRPSLLGDPVMAARRSIGSCSEALDFSAGAARGALGFIHPVTKDRFRSKAPFKGHAGTVQGLVYRMRMVGWRYCPAARRTR